MKQYVTDKMAEFMKSDDGIMELDWYAAGYAMIESARACLSSHIQRIYPCYIIQRKHHIFVVKNGHSIDDDYFGNVKPRYEGEVELASNDLSSFFEMFMGLEDKVVELDMDTLGYTDLNSGVKSLRQSVKYYGLTDYLCICTNHGRVYMFKKNVRILAKNENGSYLRIGNV